MRKQGREGNEASGARSVALAQHSSVGDEAEVTGSLRRARKKWANHITVSGLKCHIDGMSSIELR